MEQFRGTTILAVRRGGNVVIAGDGQVSLGDTVMKGNARKVRRIYNDTVLAGFAGGTADAFTLFELFEAKLDEFGGQLTRAAVELAKDWRTDRMLRRLEAMLVVASWLGEVLDDDPPYRLDTHLHEPAPCWCRLELVPDAGASTVSITLANEAGQPVPEIEQVRDIWIEQLNRYDWR